MCATLTKPFDEAAAAKLRALLAADQLKRDPKVPTDAQFGRLVTTTRRRIAKLVDRLGTGILTDAEFIAQMAGILQESHAEAVVMGRHLAGDFSPRELDDELFAELVMQGEDKYLQRFLLDLQTGRYREAESGRLLAAQVKARARLYSGKIRGTANEVFTLASPADSEFAWHQLTAEPCEDCPRIEAGGPYTAAELTAIGHPGQGKQQCLTNCGCVIVRLADGLFGFSRSYD